MLRDVRARPSYKGFYWTCAVFAAVAAIAARAGAATASSASQEAALIFLFVASFFGVWYLLASILSPLFQKSFYPAPSHFLSPYEIRMDADGLHIIGELIVASVVWRGISGVSETSGHVFLCRDGATWLGVPKRNLAATPDFVRIIQAHIAKQG
jgi:hypothetical protein